MAFEGIEVFKIDLDISTLARAQGPATTMASKKSLTLKTQTPRINLDNPYWYEESKYEFNAYVDQHKKEK